jgi:hypothetical protein
MYAGSVQHFPQQSLDNLAVELPKKFAVVITSSDEHLRGSMYRRVSKSLANVELQPSQ